MTTPSLSRRLSTADAVVIGLGSMIGAGIFSAFAPAAEAAGAWLLLGLAIAAAVAICNALSSAQLAAEYPTSGGSYLYGRERLGQWPGFFAGWSFLVGKTASCAAMALTFATYAVPGESAKPLAVAAVLGVATVNFFGIDRTARVARVIVAAVLAVLVLVVVAGATGSGGHSSLPASTATDPGWYGVLQSAGLLFFAFAGYARVATLGEEVRNSAKAIPRAIIIALSITLAAYLLIAVTVLSAIGPGRLAESARPLSDVVDGAGWHWAVPVVASGAAVASLGALLALIAGVGRTSLAMARHGDLPHWFAGVHPRFSVPHHAELALAVVVSIVVVTVDLRGAIGFSSFGVLLYYFVANAAAFTQTGLKRLYPHAVQILGAFGCAALVVTLPSESIIGGVVVLALGAVYRVLRLRMQR